MTPKATPSAVLPQFPPLHPPSAAQGSRGQVRALAGPQGRLSRQTEVPDQTSPAQKRTQVTCGNRRSSGKSLDRLPTVFPSPGPTAQPASGTWVTSLPPATHDSS